LAALARPSCTNRSTVSPRTESSPATDWSIVDRTVSPVWTYWSTSSPQYVSKDRHATYVTLTLAGEDRAASYTAIKKALDAPGLTGTHGGAIVFPLEINQLSLRDILERRSSRCRS
jgi:hypothetical protein